ncbi:MAG: SAM-dependent methyltransferase [Bacteroidales bacterium]|nr:SAM-dependent methyltransferase [Bacteroidales bacterium]
MTNGTIYLIPTPLSPKDLVRNISPNILSIIHSLDSFIVEELRTARRFLRKIGYTNSFDDVLLQILNEHTPVEEHSGLLNIVLQGRNTGVMSEAGMPGVADPGAELIRLAHEMKIKVVPLPGTSSILLALAASGLNGQNFVFHGYLPVKPNDREKRIKWLEKESFIKNQTQIFIETPYRNEQMFNSLMKICRNNTQLCIACNLTAEDEFIKTASINEWKGKNPFLNKIPAVFLLLKQ